MTHRISTTFTPKPLPKHKIIQRIPFEASFIKNEFDHKVIEATDSVNQFHLSGLMAYNSKASSMVTLRDLFDYKAFQDIYLTKEDYDTVFEKVYLKAIPFFLTKYGIDSVISETCEGDKFDYFGFVRKDEHEEVIGHVKFHLSE